jgi:Ulp1 family protease
MVIGYDCGVYALWYAEAICQEQFHSEQLAMSVKAVTAEQITQFRAKLKQLIQQLAK